MKTLAKELLKCISAIRNDVHKRRILKACWPCVLKPRKRLEEHQNPFCPPTLTAASLHWEMTFHHSLRATNRHNWSCFWNHRVCGTEAENNRESSTSGRRKKERRQRNNFSCTQYTAACLVSPLHPWQLGDHEQCKCTDSTKGCQ